MKFRSKKKGGRRITYPLRERESRGDYGYVRKGRRIISLKLKEQAKKIKEKMKESAEQKSELLKGKIRKSIDLRMGWLPKSRSEEDLPPPPQPPPPRFTWSGSTDKEKKHYLSMMRQKDRRTMLGLLSPEERERLGYSER